MDIKKLKKILLKAAILYWMLVFMIYAVAYPQFRYSEITTETLPPSTIIGDLVDGVEIRQRVVIPADQLNSISLNAATYGRENPGEVKVRIEDAGGQTVAELSKAAADFENCKYTKLPLLQPIEGHKDEVMTVVVSSEGCLPGNTIAVYAGDAVSTGKFDVAVEIQNEDRYLLNGEAGSGMLCVLMGGISSLQFYKHYWLITGGVFVLAVLLCAWWVKQANQGHNNPLVMVYSLLTKYNLLLRQLISREFKAKYKRSALGMAWSLLNPLLTMAVQYVVFSTLFKSDIENYPLYLLTGIVMMNFFNEAIGMGMTSITANAALIKKVYVPKFVYPVTRVITSSINFLLAFVPIFLVMFVTRTPIRVSMLLLIFDILCLIGFLMGMCLILTTAMTFFQDTQFIWSVLSMLWFYVTPVFYPERIIPKPLLPYFRLNPMYHYIGFARACIINGVSAEPTAYLWCITSSLVVLLIGALIFKKNQDKFILYI